MQTYQNAVPFVRDGILTVEAVLWLKTIVDAWAEMQADIAALEARIEALEP